MAHRIVIGGPTALRIACDRACALCIRPTEVRANDSLDDIGCHRHPPRHRELEAIRAACEPYGTVHLYVPRADARTRHRGFSSHVWGGPVSGGSLLLWEVPETELTVSVATPALALLQTATLADDPPLLGAACELLGRFAGAGGDRPTSPPCRRAVMEDYLSSLPEATPGLRRVRRLVGLAFENGWSPLEVATAGMLSLPRDLGGLGLPRPQLNHAIHLPPAQERQLGYSPLHADLAWPAEHVVVEYQGRHHFGNRNVAEDDMDRASVLRQTGWWVEQWAHRDLRDLLRLDEGAGRVAERLRCPLPAPDGALRSLQGRLYAGLTRWRDLLL